MKNYGSFFTGKYLSIFFSGLLFLLISCNSKVRMQETFEGETLNAPPPQFPAPDPPVDQVIWGTQKMIPRVSARPGAGQWVVIGAKEAMQDNQSATILSAVSDTFTGSIDIGLRGGLSMRLDGPGGVAVFLYDMSEKQTALGGFAMHNRPFTAPDLSYLRSNDVDLWSSDPLRETGTGLGTYSRGSIVEFSWSISQKDALLNINASPGGTVQSLNLPTKSASGLNIFPMKKLLLIINGYHWTRDTRLFVDDVKVEEL